MLSTKLALTLFLVAAAANASPAAAPKPAPVPKAGHFAFNWLKPDRNCVQLTAKDVAKLHKCEATDNAFGLSTKSLMCKIDSHTELVVYETAAQCQEALETMQANGD
jgi:hypothetical protein